MPDGEDWLLRPVLRGLCRYESLLDGTMDLGDILCLNDALDVIEENDRRINEVKE